MNYGYCLISHECVCYVIGSLSEIPEDSGNIISSQNFLTFMLMTKVLEDECLAIMLC